MEIKIIDDDDLDMTMNKKNSLKQDSLEELKLDYFNDEMELNPLKKKSKLNI